MRLAASLERGSEHPLAAAIVEAAASRRMHLIPPRQFRSLTGTGRDRHGGGREVAVGNDALLEELGSQSPTSCSRTAEEMRTRRTDRGLSPPSTDAPPACSASPIPLSRTPREAVRDLQREGLRVVMLTGDSQTTAEAVARKLGISDFEAGVLPEHKAEVVKKLQEQGRVVAMAGDGINDAPALAQAQCRHCHGHRHRCCHGERRHHAAERRPAGPRAGAPSEPRRDAQHQAEFVLRVYLQLARRADRGGNPLSQFGILLQPDHRGRGYELQPVSVITNALRLRRVKL